MALPKQTNINFLSRLHNSISGIRSGNSRWPFILILITALSLRLYRLGYHNLWYDEVFTVLYAKTPIIHWNEAPYSILIQFWIKFFGMSEFSLRFPSAVFNFMSVVLVFFLGKEIFDTKVALIASVFSALSPFHLWYAQEARAYSMILFLGTFSSYLLIKAIRNEELKLWLPFILISILGLYTNYFYIPLFAAQALYCIFSMKFRIDLRKIAYFSIIFLSFGSALASFFFSFFYFLQGCWIPKPTWNSLVVTLENFILGYNGFAGAYFISNILACIFLASVFTVIGRKNIRSGVYFCISLLAIPIILIFIFSKIFFSVYLDRGLIILSPYLYLVLSLGLVFLKKNIRIASILVLVSLFILCDVRYFKDSISPAAHHAGVHLKRPIKPAIEFVRNSLEPEDLLVVTGESVLPMVKFYIKKDDAPVYFLFIPGINSSITQKPFEKSYFIMQRPIEDANFCIPLHKIGGFKFKRLWVISSNWERDGGMDVNSSKIKERLEAKFKLEFVRVMDGLWIFRYRGA